MNVCVIYHSYSGITRRLAETVRAACDGDAIEVMPRHSYNAVSAYTLGCMRARNQECDPIDPDTIDVSKYDLIVLGTPVWAFRATPAMNAAITGLKGAQGKSAVIFATCGGKPGKTIPLMKKALEGRGVRVIGDMVFVKGDTENREKVDALIKIVRDAAETS